MKKNTTRTLFLMSLAVASFILVSLVVGKKIDCGYSIRDKLNALKKSGAIIDFENLRWEYDLKNISSFDVKFSNGKTGSFRYAKFNDGEIEFERMSEYGGYAIRGYTIFKENNLVADIWGYRKLLGINTLEEMIRNLNNLDNVISEMPVLESEHINIYDEGFISSLPDTVHYEDDEMKIIFFRVKK